MKRNEKINNNASSVVTLTTLAILLIAMIFCLIIMPAVAHAEGKTYKTSNLEESLKEEKLEYDLSDYKETDNQVVIYLFRGKGCTVCRSFLSFLNSIVPEYGKYFKVVSYEVWNDSDNKKLMNEVADFTGEAVEGVPYIVIGNKVFGGYYSGYDAEIKEAITKEYNSDEKYDVMEEMAKATAEKVANRDYMPIWCNLGITAVGTGIVIFYIHHSNKRILKKLDNLNSKKK